MMKTLKEILAERKRAAQSIPATAVLPYNTDNHVAEQQAPAYVCSEPKSEFQALFVGIEEF